MTSDETDGEDIQAIIILLLEACQIDGETEEIEINFIKNLLINKFNFTQGRGRREILIMPLKIDGGEDRNFFSNQNYTQSNGS